MCRSLGSSSSSRSSLKIMVPRRRKKCRTVSFGEIDIAELSYTLGDHPCANGGAPLATSNDLQERIKFQVDFFEKHRPKRRTKKQMIIPKRQRQSILLSSGFGMKAIKEASADAKRVKLGRMATLFFDNFPQHQQQKLLLATAQAVEQQTMATNGSTTTTTPIAATGGVPSELSKVKVQLPMVVQATSA